IGADATKYAHDFYDVGGNTTSPPTCNGVNVAFNCSHPGWDYVSGLGEPDVTNLALDIDGTTTPINNTTPAPSPGASGPKLNACTDLFTGAPNAASFILSPGTHNPQLDIVKGDLALSGDGKSLITTLTIQDLSTTVP